jgi:hypothetical protein
MEKVRIAVAGAGSIGIRHIEEIQRSLGTGDINGGIMQRAPRGESL